ncbi:unnamed protein product [Rhizophagus irregularis]|nr:unnamed protein product [Rhizophagus irregularis]
MYASMLIENHTKIAEICTKAGVAEKTAKSQVYTSSLPKVSESNLYKKTQRAGSVYKVFRKIIDPATKKEVMGLISIKFMGESDERSDRFNLKSSALCPMQ